MKVEPEPYMSTIEDQKPAIPASNRFKRQALRVSQESLVKTGFLSADQRMPLVVWPAIEGLSLCGWTERNREFIETGLRRYGALLFRGFGVTSAVEFERFIETISGELIEYSYGSTPRSRVSGSIYTSTEYPSDQTIPLHNEMSYSRNWPMKIWFFCLEPPEVGGRTPIGDSRRVFAAMNPEVKERFLDKGVLYVRNYGYGLDLPWQDVFQTSDKRRVEGFCRDAGIETEWMGGGRLRTRQRCQAAATHPKTGDHVWFNQAHLFHCSNLSANVREDLLRNFKESDLPRNAYYGDGSPIEDSVLHHVRKVYRQETTSFAWQIGDILMLDNMLVAHGRAPYAGSRKILVGMAEPFSWKGL